jgi:hypothetical protein
VSALEKGNKKMGKLLALLSGLLLSTAALATPNQNSSWDAIRADRSLTISQGNLAYTFGAAGFFNACVDGNVFRSLKAMPMCTAWKWIHTGGGQESGGDNERVCTAYTNQYVELARQQQTTICTKYQGGNGGQESEGMNQCIKSTTTTVTLPVTMNFGVYTYSNSGWHGQESGDVGDGSVLLFAKDFTVPNCN